MAAGVEFTGEFVEGDTVALERHEQVVGNALKRLVAAGVEFAGQFVEGNAVALERHE